MNAPYRADQVGSLLRPEWLADARQRFKAGTLDAAELRQTEDRAIVEAVVRLASSLHVDAIAEGVEHAEQADALRLLSCTYAQGYHFARPSAPEDVQALLVAQASARA